MKTTINPLKTIFVYQVIVEMQEQMFTQRKVPVEVPINEYHLFEITETIEKKEGKTVVLREASPLAFCGRLRSEIGGKVRESDKAPHTKLCKKCEAAYKADPRSPWNSLVNGTGLKVNA